MAALRDAPLLRVDDALRHCGLVRSARAGSVQADSDRSAAPARAVWARRIWSQSAHGPGILFGTPRAVRVQQCVSLEARVHVAGSDQCRRVLFDCIPGAAPVAAASASTA